MDRVENLKVPTAPVREILALLISVSDDERLIISAEISTSSPRILVRGGRFKTLLFWERDGEGVGDGFGDNESADLGASFSLPPQTEPELSSRAEEPLA
jgi:hypothetical protein